MHGKRTGHVGREISGDLLLQSVEEENQKDTKSSSSGLVSINWTPKNMGHTEGKDAPCIGQIQLLLSPHRGNGLNLLNTILHFRVSPRLVNRFIVDFLIRGCAELGVVNGVGTGGLLPREVGRQVVKGLVHSERHGEGLCWCGLVDMCA
jgi:hypothetical protein